MARRAVPFCAAEGGPHPAFHPSRRRAPESWVRYGEPTLPIRMRPKGASIEPGRISQNQAIAARFFGFIKSLIGLLEQ